MNKEQRKQQEIKQECFLNNFYMKRFITLFSIVLAVALLFISSALALPITITNGSISGNNASFQGKLGIGTNSPSHTLSVNGTGLNISNATRTAVLCLNGNCISNISAINGINGTNGINGINGTNGVNGVNGTSGSNGINGINGTNGVNGINGTNGQSINISVVNIGNGSYLWKFYFSNGSNYYNFTTSNLSGANGINGVNGVNGFNGTNGVNGINGTNGIDGLNGVNGINGTNGVNGINGVNGTNSIGINESINVSNATFSGRVGIGTTDLSNVLTIVTPGGFNGGVKIKSNGSYNSLDFYNDVNAMFQFGYYAHTAAIPDTAFFYNNEIGGHILYATENIERMRISNDGKVGIGTSSPSHTLTVIGTGLNISNATSTALLCLNNNCITNLSGLNGINGTNGQSINISVVNIGNGSYLWKFYYFNGSNYYNFTTSNLSGVKGDQGVQGIAGINGINGTNGTNGINGTNGYAPIKEIDYFDGVNGSNGINGTNGVDINSSNFWNKTQSDDKYLNGTYIVTLVGNFSANNVFIWDNATNQANYLSKVNTNLLNNATKLDTTNTSVINLQTAVLNLEFVNRSQLWVNTSNNATFLLGRVGIGTSQPLGMLHINGSINAGAQDVLWLSGGANSNGGARIVFNNFPSLYPTFRMAEISGITGVGASGWGGDLAFNTNSDVAAGTTVERMRIKFNGNVGIGTTRPSSTLTINSSLINGSLMIYNTTGSTHFFINGSSGYVGVGTASPVELLTVQGVTANSGSATSTIQLRQPATTISSLVNLSAGVSSGTNPYFSIATRQSSSPFGIEERMRIDGNGNVGIGTSVPSAKLDVNLVGAAAGSAEIARFTKTSAGTSRGLSVFGSDNTSSGVGLQVYNVNSDFFIANSLGNKNFIITNDGNVGLGTNDYLQSITGYKLSVQTTPNSNLLLHDFGGYPGVTATDDGASYIQLTINGDPLYLNTGTNGDVYVAGNLIAGASAPGGGSISATDMYSSDNVYSANYDLETLGNEFYSDSRLKINIVPLTPVLGKVLQLNPITYKIRNNSVLKTANLNKTEVGFLAQDVQAVFPELVIENKNGYLGINYPRLNAILVKSIQEQQSQITLLQEENMLIKTELCNAKSDYSFCKS